MELEPPSAALFARPPPGTEGTALRLHVGSRVCGTVTERSLSGRKPAKASVRSLAADPARMVCLRLQEYRLLGSKERSI